MRKKQYFRFAYYLVICLLIISTVTFGQDPEMIDNKITILQRKQDSLDRKINQFTVGWDFKGEVKNSYIDSTGDFGEILKEINDEDYLLIVESIGDGSQSNGITTCTGANMNFNFRSDIVAMSSIWKIVDPWGGAVSITLDNVLLQAIYGNTSIEYGTFQEKLTPLTLFYPFIELNTFNPNRAFAKEKERIAKKEQVNNGRLFTGARLQSSLGAMNLRAIASTIPPLNNQRYILGVQAIDEISKMSSFGLTYVNLFDGHSLAAITGQAIKNELVSLMFRQGIGNHYKIEGEVAKSYYCENVFSDEFEPISDFAQNLKLSMDRKGVLIDLNYIRTGAYYVALPVYKKDVELRDSADDDSVSSQIALPYGDSTPNRVGWRQTLSCNPFPYTRIIYGNTRLTQVLPTDETGNPCSPNSSLSRFNINEWGFVVNIDDVLARIAASKLLSKMANNFELSFFRTREKTFRENGDTDEISSVLSYDYGLSCTLQSGWECDWGYKVRRDEKKFDNRWGISIFSLSKNFDSNSKLIFTSKRIGYQSFRNESDSLYSLSNLVELQVCF